MCSSRDRRKFQAASHRSVFEYAERTRPGSTPPDTGPSGAHFRAGRTERQVPYSSAVACVVTPAAQNGPDAVFDNRCRRNDSNPLKNRE